MDDITEIDATLLAFGIALGEADARRKLAGKLHAEGVTPGMLDLVGRHLEAFSKDAPEAARVLASLVRTPAKLKARHQDVQAFEQAAIARKNGHYPGHPVKRAPAPACDTPAAFVNGDLRRRAYALHVSDRKSVADVAAALGITEAKVEILVEEEENLRRAEDECEEEMREKLQREEDLREGSRP